MKTISTLILVLLSLTSIAQNISGQAFYESKTTVNTSEIGRKDMDENMRKMIADRMKNYLEKTYILTFNGDESIYIEDEKLEMESRGGMMNMMMGSFSPGIQYKNLKTNQIIEEREFYGKQFLIKDTLTNLEWTLEKESKQIGQYVVFKATAVKKIDKNDLSMARRRRNDDKEKGIKEDKEGVVVIKDSTKVDGPLNEVEVPKEVIVTAWYTPQIPINNGPGEFVGLPGLILELNFYRTTILCSKIILNPKEATAIKAPKKGKVVSRAEYNKIAKEKLEEMRENFRGRDRKGGAHFRGGN